MSHPEASQGATEGAPPARRRLALLALIAVLPLFLLALYAYHITSRAVRDLVDSGNSAAAAISSELLAAEFEDWANLASAFARVPGLMDAVVREDEEALRGHLSVLVEADDRIVRAFVSDPDGRLWSDYPRAPESLGEDFSYRDWYEGVTESWSPYVSEVYRRHAEPRLLLVAVGVPVRDGAGQPVGVLVFQIELERLTAYMRQIEVGQDGFVFLLDHTGSVAAHPRLELQERLYDEYAALAPVNEAIGGSVVTAEYVDPMTSQAMLATFRPVPVRDRQWLIVAQQPLDAAYGLLRSLRVQIGLAGALVAAFALLVVVRLGRAHDRTRRLNDELSARNAELRELTAALENEIEERRVAQEALREARDELEERVEQRTAALRESEEQLRHAQKMEGIGRLAGGIAHDFNNMLSVIIGYSDILLADLDSDGAAREEIEEIRAAGERASALTQQLLAFSRRQMLQPQVLDLNEVIGQMEGMLRRLIGEDIDLVTRLRPEVDPVEADPSRIEQVFMNLALNARDAMPDGGKLTVETANVVLDEEYVDEHPEAQPGPHVMLAVSDTGEGMDAKTRERIFDPFFTTKERGKGTGLGLSTVYGIVKQSGGNIWVYSEPGRGTTFKVYLPRAAGAPEPVKPTRDDSMPLRGSGTVLVVEDEPGVRGVARAVLERAGYTVLVAGDVEEALEAADAHSGPINLLLTDVVLPTMGGRELSERMRSRQPSLRVLYMSGYTDDAVVHRGILQPGTAFLEKPLQPRALLAKAAEVLAD